MGWKPKEKSLTEEEAVDLARRTLEKYWFGSEVLVAGVKSGAKAIACPLHPSFRQGSWLMVFHDPTEFSSENAVVFAREWHRRYSNLGIRVINIMAPRFAVMRDAEKTALVLKKAPLPFVNVLDWDLVLSQAFGAVKMPKVLLLHEGQIIFNHSGEDGIEEVEIQLQKFVRREDPGLPLLTIFRYPGRIRKDLDGIDLANPKAKVELRGAWKRGPERIVTADPQATLTVETTANFFSLIARSSKGAEQLSEITIEIDDGNPYETSFGKDLEALDDGSAVVALGEVALYEALIAMNSEKKRLTLRFLEAGDHPVEVFGLRFGQSVTENQTMDN